VASSQTAKDMLQSQLIVNDGYGANTTDDVMHGDLAFRERVFLSEEGSANEQTAFQGNCLRGFAGFRDNLLNEARMQAEMMLFYQLYQQGFDRWRVSQGLSTEQYAQCACNGYA
jgi:hypothetical protein